MRPVKCTEVSFLPVCAAHCCSFSPTAFSSVHEVVPDVALVVAWACWLFGHEAIWIYLELEYVQHQVGTVFPVGAVQCIEPDVGSLPA